MDIKYNNIAFHTRLAILMKKKINCETECVVKDTNHNTYIRIDKLKAYFDKINS